MRTITYMIFLVGLLKYHVSCLDFHVAPMQGYTNFAFRQLFRELSCSSPSTVLWTEMEKIPDLLDADAGGLERRFGAPGKKSIVLQVGGNEAVQMGRCMQHLSAHGYTFSEINLNAGCPSIESGGATTFGATLMKQPKLTRELLSVLKESTNTGSSSTEISIKCRIAVLETPDDIDAPFTESQYEKLTEYVQYAQEGGISHLALHARAAVLSGLSPTKNRQAPPLDYSVVERLARDFPMLRVTLNGGISRLSQYNQLVKHLPETSVSSLMAGRWILRRPLDLAFVTDCTNDGCAGPKDESASLSAVKAVESYTNFVRYCFSNSKSKQSHLPSLQDLVLPMFMVSEQLREDYERVDDSHDDDCCNDARLEVTDMEDVYDILTETIKWMETCRGTKQTKFSADSIQFNKLNSSFKSLVCTKVANKWKRNRSEL